MILQKSKLLFALSLLIVALVACSSEPDPIPVPESSGETGSVVPTAVSALATAPPQELPTAVSYPDPAETAPTEVPPTLAPVVVESYPDPTAEPTDENVTVTTPVVVEEPEPAGPVTFSIDPMQSIVSFALDEDLRGERVTVVGSTNDVSGDLTLDFANPSGVTFGTIEIQAASLETDNSNRNGAIRRFVLSTNEYPVITFTPTSFNNLPDAVSVGDTVEFEIVGDLTVRDITQSLTFAATVTILGDNQLSGTAFTTILQQDFGINIPSVPMVANVEDEIDLTIAFVAISQ